MRKFLIAIAALAIPLGACTTTVGPVAEPPPISATVPVVRDVCTQINSDKFDLALKAYGAVADSVTLLIQLKAITPGSPKALALANANDKVLAAFRTAEYARRACNATSYNVAIGQVSAGINEVRAALQR